MWHAARDGTLDDGHGRLWRDGAAPPLSCGAAVAAQVPGVLELGYSVTNEINTDTLDAMLRLQVQSTNAAYGIYWRQEKTADGREVALVWDTAGVEDRLYAQGELNYLLEGNLLDGTNLTQPINNSIATFNPMPSEAERMHCVLFVLAPGIAMIPALISFAIIPWGGTLAIGGDEVKVIVLSTDNGKISCSMRQVDQETGGMLSDERRGPGGSGLSLSTRAALRRAAVRRRAGAAIFLFLFTNVYIFLLILDMFMYFYKVLYHLLYVTQESK